MRDVIRKTVAEITPPSLEERKEATARGGDRAAHDQFQEEWGCLNQIETADPPVALPQPDVLTLAAWNIERCKRVEASAALLRASGADIILATEMDRGMARSGQRHTTRDLARQLGFGYVFGVEFVELGIGDDYETAHFADVPNAGGLHGNAILSRYPLTDAAILPLDAGGAWFVNRPKGDGQFRVGGRMAMAARVGPVVFAAVHYESESDAAGRADQTDRLLAALEAVYGPAPTVIGGDLNTRALSDTGMDRAARLAAPGRVEPTFDRFAAAGYDWRSANTGAPTTRAQPERPAVYPLKLLDWILTRTVAASDPRILPAVCGTGDYLSDHECLLARIHVGDTP